MELFKTPSWCPEFPPLLIFRVGSPTHTQCMSTKAGSNKEMMEAQVFQSRTHTGPFLSKVRLSAQLKASGCGRQSHNARPSHPISVTGQVVFIESLHSALSTCFQLFLFFSFGNKSQNSSEKTPRPSVCKSKTEHGYGNRFLLPLSGDSFSIRNK